MARRSLRRRRRAAIGPILALTLVVAACSGGTTAPGTSVEDLLVRLAADDVDHDALVDELCDGARAEGEVVLNGLSTGPSTELLVAGVGAACPGLRLEHLALRAPEQFDRLAAEVDGTGLRADVVVTNTAGLGLLLDRDVLAAGVDVLAPEGVETVVPTDRAVGAWVEPYVIAWNTERAGFTAAPSTWDDLLAPAWSGCAISGDGIPSWRAWLLDQRGEDGLVAWTEGLVANGGTFLMGAAPGARAASLAAGEVDCLAADQLVVVERVRAQGAPVAWVVPDAAPAVVTAYAIARGTTRPYAAALLVAWAVGPDGSRVLAEAGLTPVDTRAVPAGAPARTWLGPSGRLDGRVALPDPARALDLERRSAATAAELVARLGS